MPAHRLPFSLSLAPPAVPDSPVLPPDAQSPSPADQAAWVDLEHYRVTDYRPGGLLPRVLWFVTSLLLIDSGWPLPSSARRTVLRWFGARIGKGVVIKPHVRIKFPWKLEIGDHTWIGEGTWIDNLADVRIGSHVCISQGVYFCTGSHNHRKRSFDLLTAPIVVEDGAWIAARSTLLQGVTVGANALVAAASMVHKDVAAATVVGGNPATFLQCREAPEA